jgi:hypothetical protein
VAIADIGCIATPLIIRTIIRPDRSRVNTTRSRTTPNIDLSDGWHRNSHSDTCNRRKQKILHVVPPYIRDVRRASALNAPAADVFTQLAFPNNACVTYNEI